MANKQEEKEVCITHEEYLELMTLQKETNKGVIELKYGQDIIKADVALIKPMVTGNGHPETGLAYRVAQIETWMAEQKIKTLERLKEEREEIKTKKQRHWEVAKPILTRVIEWIVLGGGLYLILGGD